MWGGDKMITVTKISIGQQYSLHREVMETPAFKIVKPKCAYGQKSSTGSNPSFQVYGLEGTDFFFISDFILRKYFIKLHLKIFLLKRATITSAEKHFWLVWFLCLSCLYFLPFPLEKTRKQNQMKLWRSASSALLSPADRSARFASMYKSHVS